MSSMVKCKKWNVHSYSYSTTRDFYSCRHYAIGLLHGIPKCAGHIKQVYNKLKKQGKLSGFRYELFPEYIAAALKGQSGKLHDWQLCGVPDNYNLKGDLNEKD